MDEQLLAAALARFDAGDLQGAETDLTNLLKAASGNDPLLPNLYMALTYAESCLNRFDLAREYGGKLLALWQGTADEAVALHQLAVTERMAGDLAAALRYLEQEKKLLDASGPESALRRGENLYERGFVSLLQKDLPLAQALLTGSLNHGQLTGDLMLTGLSQQALGDLCMARGDKTGALALWRQAADAFRALGDPVALREAEALIRQAQGEG